MAKMSAWHATGVRVRHGKLAGKVVQHMTRQRSRQVQSRRDQDGGCARRILPESVGRGRSRRRSHINLGFARSCFRLIASYHMISIPGIHHYRDLLLLAGDPKASPDQSFRRQEEKEDS